MRRRSSKKTVTQALTAYSTKMSQYFRKEESLGWTVDKIREINNELNLNMIGVLGFWGARYSEARRYGRRQGPCQRCQAGRAGCGAI